MRDVPVSEYGTRCLLRSQWRLSTELWTVAKSFGWGVSFSAVVWLCCNIFWLVGWEGANYLFCRENWLFSVYKLSFHDPTIKTLNNHTIQYCVDIHKLKTFDPLIMYIFNATITVWSNKQVTLCKDRKCHFLIRRWISYVYATLFLSSMMYYGMSWTIYKMGSHVTESFSSNGRLIIFIGIIWHIEHVF